MSKYFTDPTYPRQRKAKPKRATRPVSRPLACAGREVRSLVFSHYARKHYDDQTKIYFMLSGDYVKIGKSVIPEVRLKEITRATKFDIVLLGCTGGKSCDETTLHTLFARHRFVGEWFRRTKNLDRAVEVLCRLKRGEVERRAQTTVFRSTPDGSFHVC